MYSIGSYIAYAVGELVDIPFTWLNAAFAF
jgi:hypothetical protein